LNVRGKRCNIVECYPAVEYDYSPAHLVINAQTDVVHVQWTGSNSHQNGGGGGDGQTGDTGQGVDGTDRHTIAQVLDLGLTYPIPLDKFPDNMWSRSNCYSPYATKVVGTSSVGFDTTPNGDISASPNQLDCAVQLSSSGFWTGLGDVQTANPSAPGSTQMNALLNPKNNGGNGDNTSPNNRNPPATLIGGVVMQFTPAANVTYYYVDTRNNAFSNRGQKGLLTVYYPSP